MAALLAMLLAHSAPEIPSHWHMSCERFQQRRVEIMHDPAFNTMQARWLIGFLRSKVDGPCTLACDVPPPSA